jgi:hypothetical protein
VKRFICAALLFALCVFVWQARTACVSLLARHVLAKQGFPDATFKLVRLSLGCVVLEDVRLGAPDPVLAMDWVDVRFSVPEVIRGQLDRVRMRGVRTSAVVSDDRLLLPLHERLKAFLAARTSLGRGPSEGARKPAKFEIGELSCYDIQVSVRSADGREVVALRCDASALSEPLAQDAASPRYRFSAQVGDGGCSTVRIDGTVVPDEGRVACDGDLKVARIDDWVTRARRLAPQRLSGLGALPTNGSFSVRGSFALTDWTNTGPFEVAAELGRGSAFSFLRPEGDVRFQSFRVEASGTPQDVQCRLSAGVSGFRLGTRFQTAQEDGRLLSVRGTARFRETATNRWAQATLDSDWPGRSLSQVLPRLLPLFSRLLTDGGTLHAEADVAQTAQSAWRGGIRYAAEARRSTASLPAGRFGAGRVTLAGDLAVRDARPQELRVELGLEGGYFFGRGLSVKGDGRLSLAALPPYASASGVLSGQVGEYAALPKSGVVVSNGAVRFGGEATVTGLATNPVWQVALRVPEFVVSGKAGQAEWQASAGASAQVRYGVACTALEGDVWLRDAGAALSLSSAPGRAEGGFGTVGLHVDAPAFSSGNLSNAVVRCAVSASNGWARARSVLKWTGARASVPFAWSLAEGVVFLPGQTLAWDALDVAGVRVVTNGFELVGDRGLVWASGGVRVEESRFGLSVRARVPLDDPRQTDVTVSLPETELTSEDALAAGVRQVDKEAEVTGRIAAEAKVRFLGNQPIATGRVRVSDGRVRRGNLEVVGLAADVPFESGLTFRTIDRPVVTFLRAKVGNIRLDQGRVEFQVTPQEVFVDRMEVGWCKGSLQGYSVHLDPKNPKADVVVYADRIDLGEALMMVAPFKGSMEGVLYGRFPVGIDNGHVKLSTGFLYSLPGQGGKLRFDDAAPVVSLLERAGISGDVQQPLSKALSDMDFSAIRMELEPKADGDAVLRMKLDGESNFKEWPAPVALNLNLHGPLEQLLNLGVNMSKK